MKKMVQVDLTTGFLGAGKTTFLRRYVRYLVEQGHNVCILENDFGAVNVDAMLVQEVLGQRHRHPAVGVLGFVDDDVGGASGRRGSHGLGTGLRRRRSPAWRFARHG